MDKLRYLKLVHEEWPSKRGTGRQHGGRATVPPRVRKAIEENLRGKLGGEPYDLEEVTKLCGFREESGPWPCPTSPSTGRGRRHAMYARP